MKKIIFALTAFVVMSSIPVFAQIASFTTEAGYVWYDDTRNNINEPEYYTGFSDNPSSMRTQYIKISSQYDSMQKIMIAESGAVISYRPGITVDYTHSHEHWYGPYIY
jgi:hypothetical protein